MTRDTLQAELDRLDTALEYLRAEPFGHSIRERETAITLRLGVIERELAALHAAAAVERGERAEQPESEAA